MAFRCPVCQTSGGLSITTRIELPPDNRSDEITFQLMDCNQCDFRAAGVYEESRRGSLREESVDHRGYRIAGEAWKRLVKLIAACPRPHDPRCTCPAHRQLGQQDAQGRWAGLEFFRISDRFELGYTPGISS